jgi:lipopolysaccharide biosynthesis glycosyltransferase
MNLIYICVFYQEDYINLLKLLITSISIKANLYKKTTDILIMTSPLFEPLIKKELKTFSLPLYYYILDLHGIYEAACARLNIFKYNNINKYDKILYLDTDILINSNINVLFNLELCSEKLYALKEGKIGHEFWGGKFFDFSKYDKNLPGFSSGILLFKNSDSMKSLFDTIQIHIPNGAKSVCLDQPFIVYNAISQKKYDNNILELYAENNPRNINSEKIIYHFPGSPGKYINKLTKMTNLWEKIKNI